MIKLIHRFVLIAVCSVSLLTAQNNSTGAAETLTLKLTERKLPFGITVKQSAYKPVIGLALSGGGARGLAQIGTLRSFEENNIPLDYIIGTSMGSIVGGLYSAGYCLNMLDSIAINTDWNEFFSLEETDRNELFLDQKITEDKAIFAIRLDGFKPVLPTALNTGQKVSNFLTLLSINAPIHVNDNFGELLYKFKAVSTNLITGEAVVIDEGSLSTALRASSSVSFLLPPVEKDSTLLVDGGLVANIPVSITKNLGTDYTIASNTASPLRDKEELTYPWEIADQIVSIPMKMINEQQLDSADVVIQPDLTNFDNTNFNNVPQLIAAGYNAANLKIGEIKQRIEEEYYNKLPGTIKYYKNVLPGGYATKLERNFLNRYSLRDSVSNKELLYDLYSLYESCGISSLSADIYPSGDSTIVKLNYTLNPKVKEIKIKGVSVVDSIYVHGFTKGLLNKPYNERKLLAALLEIMRHYRNEGYSLADIEDTFFDETTNKLYIDISEGIIDEIEITGNKTTNLSVITRELIFDENDYYKFDEAAQGLSNLRTTNLFENVEIAVNGHPDKNKVKIIVDEKPAKLIRFGIRIDNENFTQGSIDFRHENFLGSGSELGFIAAGGLRNRSFILEHKANRIFESYLTYKIRGYFESTDINTYSEDSSKTNATFKRINTGEYRQKHVGVSVGVGAQVEKLGNLIFQARYQKEEISNLSDFTNTYTNNLFAFRFNLSIDSQDRYPFPRKGFLINTYYETAQEVLGADHAYTKFYADYKTYFPIDNIHNLAPRFVLGFADETLPLSQQFSLGGQNSFFGMREHQLRGRQVFLASLEYRLDVPFAILFDTYLKARYDLGGIWTEPEQIRFKDLRHGIGFTLSWDTPIGPADFSIGKSFKFQSLDKNAIMWGETTLYFTIGYYY